LNVVGWTFEMSAVGGILNVRGGREEYGESCGWCKWVKGNGELEMGGRSSAREARDKRGGSEVVRGWVL
jgi:hypothetical protein